MVEGLVFKLQLGCPLFHWLRVILTLREGCSFNLSKGGWLFWHDSRAWAICTSTLWSVTGSGIKAGLWACKDTTLWIYRYQHSSLSQLPHAPPNGKNLCVCMCDITNTLLKYTTNMSCPHRHELSAANAAKEKKIQQQQILRNWRMFILQPVTSQGKKGLI